MIDSRAALDMDRLPWLPDERTAKRPGRWNPVLLWGLLAVLLVAGVSYWLGMQSTAGSDDFADAPASPPAATVTLPAPGTDRAIVQPEVKPAPMPEVRPVAQAEPVKVAPAAPRRAKPAVERRTSTNASADSKAPVKAAAAKPAVAKTPTLQYWPAMESAGANGRVVRIGTFSTRRQAKKGWWQIVRHYPGMRRMKAVVAPVPSLRNGRTYYRLQFGTTSQAHSEVLCQRMRMIGQSCVVVGLQRASGSAPK